MTICRRLASLLPFPGLFSGRQHPPTELLASKGHTVSKEKRLFVQTQVHYFGHLIMEKGLGT